MTTQEYLCRHFARMGARISISAAPRWQQAKIAIDVGRDRSGEVFVIKCAEEPVIEVIDVQPRSHHLVLMVREGNEKYKFLLGRDERHWFAAAVPGDGVRDVRTAIASLRPTEIEGREAIRQGEWFFVPEFGMDQKTAVILRNEPLSRGGKSKPHVCEQMMRKGGEQVMVCRAYPTGINLASYHELMATDSNARNLGWRQMVRDAAVYARGEVRHKDHKTVDLRSWHRVYMNRERFAQHAQQIAFLD